MKKNELDHIRCTREHSSRWSNVAGGLALASAVALSTSALAATPKNALVMAMNIDAISTFDPAQVAEAVTQEILQNTCDTLVRFDPTDVRKVLPALAESWDVSPDGKEITFHLQKNAKFASGKPVTARDTALSMQRVVQLGFGNAAALTEYGFTKDNIQDRIVATDDHTLVLKFDKAYPPLLLLQSIAVDTASTTLDMATVMEQAQNNDMGNRYLAKTTECVGPYRLAKWNAGESILLQANENYWGKPPALKRVLIRHVAELGTQRLLLSKGDIDVARNLSPDDMRDLEKSATIRIEKILTPALYYWAFNASDPIFSKEKVRLAMRYLIDYDGLGKTVMSYVGVPRASYVQLGAVAALNAEEGQPFKLDLPRAKALLAEAGYPNGFEANVLIGTNSYSSPLAESIQENAAKIGVKLKLERMANAQLYARTRGREFQTAQLGWQTGVPDAHGNSSRLVYNPDNRMEAKMTQFPSWRMAWQDPAINARVTEALMETDPAKREAMYASLQKDVMQQGPFAVMFQLTYVAGLSKDLKTWAWNSSRVYYAEASK